MSEMHQGELLSPVSIELEGHNLGEIAQYLASLIHTLTAEGSELTPEKLELIASLGKTAYELSINSELLSEKTTQRTESATAPLAEPIVTALPVQEPVRKWVEEVKTEKATKPVAATPTKEPEEVAPTLPSIESETAPEPVFERPEGVDMSPQEISWLRDIVRYLSASEERKNLTDINQAVFGRSRLRKEQQNRLIELMDILTDRGVLRSYGKTYGYRTEAERDATPAPEANFTYETDDSLVEFDFEAIKHLETLIKGGEKEVHIGHFVRSFYKVQEIDRQQFNDVIGRLNYLADLGYLYHAKNSPWYGLGNVRLATEKPQGADSQPETMAQSPIETTNIHEDVFSEMTAREAEMAKTLFSQAQPGVWFKRNVLDFSSFTFASSSAFNTAYSNMTKKLIAKGALLAEGERGQRQYFVPVTETGSSIKQSSGETAKTSEPAETVTRSTRKESVPQPEEAPAKRPVSAAQIRRFTNTLTSGVEAMIDATGNDSEKLSKITRELSKAFNVTQAEARGWIDDLVTSERFHFNGQKGTRLLKKGADPNPKTLKQTPESTKKLHKGWVPEDAGYAKKIFGELLKLQHVQQYISPKDLITTLEIPKEEATAFRASIRRLANQGYLVFDKKTNPNTRSDHSRTLYLPGIKIKDQEMKERLKSNPREIYREINALIEADS